HFQGRKAKIHPGNKEFRVGKESDGFELSQLGQLKELGGSLELRNLEKVPTKDEANELKLVHKNHLKELTLEWNDRRPNKDSVQEESILESLVPHGNLKELRIYWHGGTSCPSWLCDDLSLKYLEHLCLHGVCRKNLPPLGEMRMVNERGEEYQSCSISRFPNLKRLQLSVISCLTKWVGNSACPFFSHLEVLIVRACSELTELPFSHPTCCQAQQEEKMAWFPKLWELVIENCPKLAFLPPIPWRIDAQCSAKIERAGSGFEQLIYETKLRGLVDVKGKDGLGDVLWNGLNFSSLTDVEYLCMDRCPLPPLDHM
ncbi:disease resistance protein RGA2-like, partial [Lolium rigidum]|uniref:disease resistance protein RGA2-like n=1 Tax=Lolium rigidum TaxID=89674 RepID=UPI001F5CC980